jgi:rod shape-determining protein MreC
LNWLNLNIRNIFVTVVLLILPLISINTQRRLSVTGWYDKPFSFLAGVVETGFFSFSDGVRGTTKLYLDLIDIKKENRDLKYQNQELQTRLQKMEELTKENDRLSQLLDFRLKTKMDLVSARIMSRDLLSDHATVRIDKGTHHGLKAGMAVITTEGVVGHIFRPEAFSSHILLITDRYSVVDGIDGRSRAHGILEGKGPNSLALTYIEKSDDIKPNDIIVTSGLDNIFPKGFPVAKVEDVESKTFAVSLKVTLKPVVDPEKIEEVFVITNANFDDLSKKIEAQGELVK